MASIKIEDLPRDEKITQKEMKAVMGGVIGDIGMPRFIRATLWSPGIYASAPVEPPGPVPSGPPKRDVR